MDGFGFGGASSEGFRYSMSDGGYEDANGNIVGWDYVFYNFVQPNAAFTINFTDLTAFGTDANPYQYFSLWVNGKRWNSSDGLGALQNMIDDALQGSGGQAGGGIIYKEGTYSFSNFNLQFLIAGGKGLLGGWSRVRGSANVYRGKDGTYYANVSAVGFTPSSTQGSVTFSGNVEVYSGGNLVGTQTLNRFVGASIIQSGWQDVGQGTIALPNYGGDIYLRFNVGYTYSEGAGYVAPWPAQGHFNLYIPYFVIDAWTY